LLFGWCVVCFGFKITDLALRSFSEGGENTDDSAALAV